jgi:FAD:protein FMN transferase
MDESAVYDDLIYTIADFDNKYSRFNPESMLSKINKEKELYVDNIDLVQMLQLGLQYYELSNGLFNIATETHQRAQGYDRKYSFEENKDLTPITLPLYEALKITNNKILLDERVTIDLGGIGKGYLIDKLVGDLKSKFKLKYFVINGGGDIYATSNFEKPIELWLQHPEDNTLVIGKVALKNQSLCGSSPFMRRWKDKNHILNLSKEKLEPQSSFVIADNATDADILATILTLTNFQKGIELQKSKNFEFLQIKSELMQQSLQFNLQR